ncbi:MAG: DUF2061 domain-containing protein [Candidatus Aureabacteria bacterium]|nr:DUF2061 domain-containing protein [Candidatus Auribacterota bacterium]
MIESHARSVSKAVSYRLMGTFATMLIVFIFTRKVVLSLGVGFFELLAKIGCFYLHERIWEKIRWGKIDHPLGELDVKEKLRPEDMEKVKEQLREMGYMD